jgi:SAM-dependent methyltransferase
MTAPRRQTGDPTGSGTPNPATPAPPLSASSASAATTASPASDPSTATLAARPPSTMWALGDYHSFALATVWQLGPVLVDACSVRAGQRVLDVAAGTGNVAIRAAEVGASVVACDITPEHFEAGRHEAARRGVEVEWIEGDAQRLPFDDGEFDVVTSAFGAIFAPDHRAVADELLRVCRPGGTIGMLNFRAAGASAEFFELMARWAPPPPAGALPPLLWGDEAHVRELFGDRASALEMQPGAYIERSNGGPSAYRALFATTFGPIVALRGALAVEPERLAAFDREFLEFATRANRGAAGGAAEYEYPYLLVVATKR